MIAGRVRFQKRPAPDGGEPRCDRTLSMNNPRRWVVGATVDGSLPAHNAAARFCKAEHVAAAAVVHNHSQLWANSFAPSGASRSALDEQQFLRRGEAYRENFRYSGGREHTTEQFGVTLHVHAPHPKSRRYRQSFRERAQLSARIVCAVTRGFRNRRGPR